MSPTTVIFKTNCGFGSRAAMVVGLEGVWGCEESLFVECRERFLLPGKTSCEVQLGCWMLSALGVSF